MTVKSPGFPLITFSRRPRKKKTVVVNRSNSTMDNGGLLDLSAGNDSNLRYCTASQEKVRTHLT